jgi:YVTN family beta-propeller protein
VLTGRPTPSVSRRRAIIAIGVALTLLGGCSGDDGKDAKPRPTTTRSDGAIGGGGTAGEGALGARRIGRQDDGSIVTSSGQLITPAGEQIEFAGRAVGVAVHPNGKTAALLAGTSVQGDAAPLVTVVNLETLAVVQRFAPVTPASYAGIAYSKDGTKLYASSATAGVLEASVATNGSLTETRRFVTRGYPAGLALSDDGATLYVALSKRNALAVVNLVTGATVEVPVGNVPHGVLLVDDTVWVTNQGGRRSAVGDPTNLSAGTPIVVDPETGAANTGTVSIVDPKTNTVAATIEVELQPTALARRDNNVFVTNTNSDSISVIDIALRKVVTTIAVEPNPSVGTGAAPNGLAFLPDDGVVVSLGRDNALAVYEFAAPDKAAHLEGLIPTGWYPASVAVDAAGERLVVANAQGVGTLGPKGLSTDEFANGGAYRPNVQGRTNRAWVASTSIIPFPTAEHLRDGSEQVARNNGWDRLQVAEPRKGVAPMPVPDRVGEPSPIKKVVYIIKENRTYDQVLGDDNRGNGDPSLVQFGKAITPNQHELAKRWVLFDNFYSAGGVSADGHQWVTQADDPDYVEKLFNGFPFARAYPSGGGDALAYLPSGFLWENAQKHDRTVRVYGEYATDAEDSTSAETHSDVPTLDRVLDREFPSFDLTISDQDKARMFLADLADWEQPGADMPDLVMMLLPNDHTMGTNPGYPTPHSQVADNDYGLAQVIEGLSKSRFWNEMAVFVVEDDAQGGVDHVDGHRTTAFVAGPYAARGKVDSTFYNQVNLVRTIEQILGLPPMNRMDVAAVPMRNAFVADADPAPFSAVRSSLVPASNPAVSSLSGVEREWALASAKMDFSVPDVEENRPLLNRAIWYATRGFDVPYPGDGRVIEPEAVPESEFRAVDEQ